MRCTQCLAEVGDRVGFETPSGDALCRPCYFALWGPRGRYELSAATEAVRPSSRRPRRRPGFGSVKGVHARQAAALD